MVDVKIGQARVEEKLSGDVNTLKVEVEGISKRLDLQEFINRGVLIGLLVTMIGGAIKLFIWVNN